MNDAFLYGDSAQRKEAPMAEGLLWYFPDALAAVANLSKVGNDQHNPGEPMHHARDKSKDHADCIIRHLAHAGQMDKDGVRETAKVAWRALAMLQVELEEAHGLPKPRNASGTPEAPATIPGKWKIDLLRSGALPDLEALQAAGLVHMEPKYIDDTVKQAAT